MTLNLFLIFASVFFAFALVSKRIQNGFLTLPILFTGAGFALHGLIAERAGLTYDEGGLHTLAELTLILVLAADASQICFKDLRMQRGLPLRLLLIGMPLIIIAGTLVGIVLFPDYPWYLAALVAAILAPTDAALGGSVLTSKAIPGKIKQSLDVESGLNDGLALPAVLFFACFLNMMHQRTEEDWLIFLALQIGLGPLVGAVVGWCGGHLIARAAKADWITAEFQGVAAVALAVLAFALAEIVHGNGFIAAFVAGLVYGNLNLKYSKFMHEFTETESQFLTQLTFFLFGAMILPASLAAFDITIMLYALLSLTIVRMVPVAIAMIGSRLDWACVLFMGWFGPRGLASILFALLIIQDLNVMHGEFVQAVVAMTVLFSIILHGATAAPFSKALGRRLAKTTGPDTTDTENDPAIT